MNKVGIIIPSIDRLNFLINIVEYYSKYNSPHTLYIGDSSRKDNTDIINKLSVSKNIKVKYFYIPNKNDREAIFFLSQQVLEKYIAFSGDDDFFIPESLTLCANFLQNNNDYRTAQGRGYLLSYEYCENMNKLIFLEQYWKKNEINFNNVEKRLIDFSKKYYVTEFSTHRTKEFIEDVKESEKIENRHIGEYIRCFNFIGRGKSKFVDCPYLLRIHHKKRGISSLSKTFFSYDEFLKSDSFKNSLTIFKKLLFNLLSLNNYLTDENKKEIVKKIIHNRIYSKKKKNIYHNAIRLGYLNRLLNLLFVHPRLFFLILINKFSKNKELRKKIIIKKNSDNKDFYILNNFFTFYENVNIENNKKIYR